MLFLLKRVLWGWGVWFFYGLRWVALLSTNETKLRKMTSHFDSLTRKFLEKFFFWVTNSASQNIKLNFELLTQRFNFYFSTFELLIRNWKKKFHFELLTRRLNIFLYFQVTNSKLKNKKIKKLFRVTNLIVKHFLFSLDG